MKQYVKKHWEKACAISMFGLVIFVAINVHYFKQAGSTSYPLELSSKGG